MNKTAAHPMVHRAATIQKIGGRDIIKYKQILNNDLFKGTIDSVCSEVDSLKKGVA
jgi:hypothetical protein